MICDPEYGVVHHTIFMLPIAAKQPINVWIVKA
jgi:hypothetical protein